VLILSVRILVGPGDRRVRRLSGVWHESEDTPRRRTRRLTRRAGARTHALAELSVDLPDGVIEPLQQDLQDDVETVGLPLGNILEGDLASLEVVNH
jgi:hypothetical protein